MTISGTHLANLLEFAATLGVNTRELKRNFLSKLDFDLSLSSSGIRKSELEAIILNLAQKTTDEFFGLYYGCFLNIKAIGLIFSISKSVVNVEQVIRLLKEFLEYTFPVLKYLLFNRIRIFPSD